MSGGRHALERGSVTVAAGPHEYNPPLPSGHGNVRKKKKNIQGPTVYPNCITETMKKSALA